jgi:hypothetical protein
VGLLLERKLNEREAVLHLESRDVELSSMTIRQAANGVGWEVVGSGSELKRIRAGRRVVEALSSLGDGATAEEIAGYLEVSRQAVHRQLEYAERDGLVRREEKVRETGGRPASRWMLVEDGE